MFDQAKSVVLTPAQLHKLSEEKAMAEAQKAFAEMKKAEEKKRSLHEAFMSREPNPEALSRLMDTVRHLAEQGKSELLALQFPASYLEDGGRRINNFDPEWPKSLAGYAKRAYDLYEENLRPQGYKLRAQILDFPGGKPGDVGLILSW
jgi:ribosomal 50S subunit-associated protein YjgA (DUF615 family)